MPFPGQKSNMPDIVRSRAIHNRAAPFLFPAGKGLSKWQEKKGIRLDAAPHLYFWFWYFQKSEMEGYEMSEDNKYTLVVNKKRITVSKEVYTAYYQQKEREAYLDKLSNKHNISFEECEEKGIQVDYLLSCSEQPIEDEIIKAEMLAKLMSSLEKLSGQEQLLIYNLFFKGKSERQLSAETGIPQKTINDRKRKVLLKLKKIIEK
jgi:hypothetical protein